MDKWEYLNEEVDSALWGNQLREYLNRKGSDGWELAAFTSPVCKKPTAIFKRPQPQREQP